MAESFAKFLADRYTSETQKIAPPEFIEFMDAEFKRLGIPQTSLTSDGAIIRFRNGFAFDWTTLDPPNVDQEYYPSTVPPDRIDTIKKPISNEYFTA